MSDIYNQSCVDNILELAGKGANREKKKELICLSGGAAVGAALFSTVGGPVAGIIGTSAGAIAGFKGCELLGVIEPNAPLTPSLTSCGVKLNLR